MNIKEIAKKWADNDHENALAGSRAPLEWVIEQAIKEYESSKLAQIREAIDGYIDGSPDAGIAAKLANRISMIVDPDQ